jgi:hypothetical protein
MLGTKLFARTGVFFVRPGLLNIDHGMVGKLVRNPALSEIMLLGAGGILRYLTRTLTAQHACSRLGPALGCRVGTVAIDDPRLVFDIDYPGELWLAIALLLAEGEI